MFRPSTKYAPNMRLASEDVEALNQIRKRLSFKPSFPTLRNWCTHGLLNKFTGEKIILESIFLSTGRATSIQAVHRFLCEINRMSPLKKSPARPKKVTKPNRQKGRCKKK